MASVQAGGCGVGVGAAVVSSGVGAGLVGGCNRITAAVSSSRERLGGGSSDGSKAMALASGPGTAAVAWGAATARQS